jgi:hypothetical protein
MHHEIPKLRMCLNGHIRELCADSASWFRAILLIAFGGACIMDDTTDRNPGDGKKRPQLIDYDPAAWITTEQLDAELWNAIMEDSSGSCDEESDCSEIGDDLAEDEDYEDEADERRSMLRLLATLRPRLAELLGGPHAKK